MSGRLLALSDLHVRHKANRRALEDLPGEPGSWLILGGDIAEDPAQLAWTLDLLAPRFERLIWVPGNHDLWASPKRKHRGVALYEHLVELCRQRGVVTPEDPFVTWRDEAVLVPLFLLYDYSFAPDGRQDPAAARAWAGETGLVCTDEFHLRSVPHSSVVDWCHDRVRNSAARLDRELPDELPTVLINHFPLRHDLVRLPRIPRFRIWCGTRLTEDWHRRYRARVVVSGHLHMPCTEWRHGTRFEEVSLGYPREWQHRLRHNTAAAHLREILPGPKRAPPGGWSPPRWRR